ncbi:MAG: helix-turn-helix transcriptional regulator [Chlorobiaceae bacterium]|nr:helix-turn-helix transcriptional regulator [Chlorobiaceae bacterium]
MESTILSSRFDWLSSDEQLFLELDSSNQDLQKRAHLMPEEIGAGWLQSMHLPLNQVIRQSCVSFKPEVSGRMYPLTKIVEHFSEPALCVQSAKRGRVILSDHNLEQDYLVDRDSSLFQHCDFRHSSAKMDTSEDVEYCILIIGDSVLREMCGEEHAYSLLKGIRVALMPSGVVNKVPRHINAILHSAFSDSLTGSVAKMHAQSKVLDYLCGLYTHFTSELMEQKLPRSIHDIIQQIHDDLIQYPGKVPTLYDLARQYELSVKQLSSEFKNKYGKSLISYISEVRLNEAHAALQQTNTPLKTMAKHFGYSHVNHFITAFSKQFGYPPGSLRKKNTVNRAHECMMRESIKTTLRNPDMHYEIQ